jgi:hypothetical protein
MRGSVAAAFAAAFLLLHCCILALERLNIGVQLLAIMHRI